jgi:lipopolysaccharide export system permease protein
MLEIREQMFTELTEKVTIYVQEKDDRTGRIKGVQILEKAHPTDLRPQLTTADWGQLVPRPADDALLLELHDGEIHSLPDDNDPAKYSVARFAVHNLYVRNAERDFENSNRTSRGDREMNLTALGAAAAREREDQRKVLADAAAIGAKVARRQWRLLDPAQRSELLGREPGGGAPAAGFREATLRATQQEVELAASSARVQVQILESHHILENKYRVEFHKKLAIPVACLIFVLLGLPLAVTTARSGRGVSVTLAMALYLVYYLFLIGGEKLADRGRLNPVLAMWTANIVLAVVSVPVLIAAVRESGLLWRRRRAPAPAAPPPTPAEGKP